LVFPFSFETKRLEIVIRVHAGARVDID